MNVIYICIAGMMLSSVAFMIAEILNRTKPEFAKVEAKKP